MPGTRAVLAAFLVALAAASIPAHAQSRTPTTLTLDTFTPGMRTVPFDRPPPLVARMQFVVAQCPAGFAPAAAEAPVTFRVNGAPLDQQPFYIAFGRSCANGVYSVKAESFVLDKLPIGEFTVVAEFPGSVDLEPSRSAPIVVQITPTATLRNPEGPGQVLVASRGAPETWWYCAPPFAPGPRFEAKLADTLGVVQPGPVVRLPFGAIDYLFENCRGMSDFLLPVGVVQQHMVIQYPDVIPPGSELWNYASPGDGQAPRWMLVPATFNGSQVTFRLRGPEDKRDQLVQSMRGTLALVLQHPVLPPIDHQGMWWGGPEENGWGLGIAQSGERLFMTLFIYDSDRTPIWFVLSEGAWDPAHSSFTGHVFRPSGTWFGDYNGSLFRAGAPAGIVTLQVMDGQSARLNYAISGQTGTKALRRFDVATPGPRSGLWWGGAQQNGWGISLQESGTGLFAAWYTYDSRGQVTWLVMPDGRPVSGGYSGVVYRAFGATWLGVPYVAASFSTVPVGQMRILFDGNDRGTMSFDVEGTARSMPIERFALP